MELVTREIEQVAASSASRQRNFLVGLAGLPAVPTVYTNQLDGSSRTNVLDYEFRRGIGVRAGVRQSKRTNVRDWLTDAPVCLDALTNDSAPGAGWRFRDEPETLVRSKLKTPDLLAS